MSQYFLKLGFDNPEVVKQLDCLAAKYNLTTFVKIAVEALLATDEGKRLISALGAKEPTKRKKKNSPSSGVPHHEVVQKQPVVELPVQHLGEEVKPKPSTVIDGREGSSLYSTDQVVSQMLKRG